MPDYDYDQRFIWIVYMMLVATVLSGAVHWMDRLGLI